MNYADRQVCAWEAYITKDLPNKRYRNIDEAQSYVNRLWAQHAKWYRPAHKYSPPVEIARGDKATMMWREKFIAWAGISRKGHRILLREDGLYPLDCIHEVAHLLAPKHGHDERFVATLLSLLGSEFPAHEQSFWPINVTSHESQE